ncbi:MAG: hypothetical protein ACE14M_14135 [Terriglobales bacterium]
MKHIKFIAILVFLLSGWSGLRAYGESCQTPSAMQPATHSALENTARQYFQLAQQGNTAALQQNATPGFTALADIVSNNKAAFAGDVRTRIAYLLENAASSSQMSSDSSGRSEFFCGVYNSPERVVFAFPKLASGQYAVVIQDASGATPHTVSWILQQTGAQWKIADLILRPQKIGGHDATWFVNQARAYKAKGQLHNAWFYYLTADQLLRPFGALSTPPLDRLYDEARQSMPNDLPYNGPVDLSAGGKTYKITQLFVAPVGDELDLVVKYQVPDISDTTKTFQDNTAVIKGLVAKYPEYREAFGGVVARAVDPSGRDYGTLLAMNQVK